MALNVMKFVALVLLDLLPMAMLKRGMVISAALLVWGLAEMVTEH
jgi:hypothetical protein